MEYIRRIGEVVVEHRRTMVTVSLLLYIALYVAVSFGGISFQAQPALAAYYYTPSIENAEPNDTVLGTDTFDVGVYVLDESVSQDVEADIRNFDNGNHWGNSTCTANCWANITRTFSEGEYTWEAQVCDTDDNCTGWDSADQPWSFTVDLTSPSVTASNNTSNPGVNEKIEITANADDPAPSSNIQDIRIYVNATQVASCTVDSDPASCVTEQGPYAEGSAHSFNATATDEGGNTGASSIREFNVNNRPNDPSNPDPSDGAVENDATPDLNVTYTDPDGEDGYVEFYVNGTFEGSCSSVSDGGTCGIITGTIAEGLHNWSAIAYDSHDDRNPAPSPTWTFTVDTEANTQIGGGGGAAASDWQTSDFDVSVDDDDDAVACQYAVDDDNDGSFDTPWRDRACDSTFTVTVGSSADCTVEGVDECRVEVNMTDDLGNTGRDDEDYNIDYNPPSINCEGCDAPDPVKSGAAITFGALEDDAASGTDLVEICEDDTCSDTFCTYSPDTGEDFCEWPTPDSTFVQREYCIRATDQAGLQSPVQCEGSPGYNFTIKKWVGDSCQADVECLLGACSDGRCRVAIVPPPEITLTSFQGTTDVHRASVVPSPNERPRNVPHGGVRTMNVTLSNPLAVPDKLYITFGGSAVARGLVDVQDAEMSGLSCSTEENRCMVFLDSEEQRMVQIPLQGMRPSRGTLAVHVTSATSEKSAEIAVPVVVRQQNPLDVFRAFINGLF